MVFVGSCCEDLSNALAELDAFRLARRTRGRAWLLASALLLTGVAELFGRSIRERARALIAIAHPDFRDALLAQARRTHYL